MSIIIVVLLASVLNVNTSFIWAQKLENLIQYIKAEAFNQVLTR